MQPSIPALDFEVYVNFASTHIDLHAKDRLHARNVTYVYIVTSFANGRSLLGHSQEREIQREGLQEWPGREGSAAADHC